MNIDDAITELLFESRKYADECNYAKHNAMKLAISALKRVKAGRPAPPSLAYLPLSGETDQLEGVS